MDWKVEAEKKRELDEEYVVDSALLKCHQAMTAGAKPIGNGNTAMQKTVL